MLNQCYIYEIKLEGYSCNVDVQEHKIQIFKDRLIN